MAQCSSAVLVFASPSLLCSTRSPTLIKVLITSLPLPIVLLDRPLVLPPYACAADVAEPPSSVDGTQDLTRHGTSCMSIYHKPLSMPSAGVLRSRPSVATMNGGVCDLAPVRVCPWRPTLHRLRELQLPAYTTLPAPPSTTVSKHVADLQRTRIPPLIEQVKHIARVVQPAPPPTITTGGITRAVAFATVSALRHQGSASSLRTSGVGAEHDDGAGGGHGGHGASRWSARVYCSRARSSKR